MSFKKTFMKICLGNKGLLNVEEYMHRRSMALIAWNEALEQAKQAALSAEPEHIEREINKLRVSK